MSTLFATLICLSPLLFVAAGYYLGRYGSPVVLRLQRPTDRRPASAGALVEQTEHDEHEETEIYTSAGAAPRASYD